MIDKNYFLERMNAGESLDDIGKSVADMMNEAKAEYDAQKESLLHQIEQEEQRREELDRFKSEYLSPHRFEKKHNVAVEDEQWELLDLIVRRVGDRKSIATSYLNSIIAAHLREVLPKVKEWMKL